MFAMTFYSFAVSTWLDGRLCALLCDRRLAGPFGVLEFLKGDGASPMIWELPAWASCEDLLKFVLASTWAYSLALFRT